MTLLVDENFEGEGMPDGWRWRANESDGLWVDVDSVGDTELSFDYSDAPLVGEKSLILYAFDGANSRVKPPAFAQRKYVEFGFVLQLGSVATHDSGFVNIETEDGEYELFALKYNADVDKLYMEVFYQDVFAEVGAFQLDQPYKFRVEFCVDNEDWTNTFVRLRFAKVGELFPESPQLAYQLDSEDLLPDVAQPEIIFFSGSQFYGDLKVDCLVVGDEIGDGNILESSPDVTPGSSVSGVFEAVDIAVLIVPAAQLNEPAIFYRGNTNLIVVDDARNPLTRGSIDVDSVECFITNGDEKIYWSAMEAMDGAYVASVDYSTFSFDHSEVMLRIKVLTEAGAVGSWERSCLVMDRSI